MRLAHFVFTFIFCFIFSFSQHNINSVCSCSVHTPKYVHKSLSVAPNKCVNQTSIVKAPIQPILMSAEVGNLSFDLLSLNVRGIRSNDKRMTTFNWLNTHTSDQAIIFSQETHFERCDDVSWTTQFNLAVKKLFSLTDYVTLVGF